MGLGAEDGKQRQFSFIIWTKTKPNALLQLLQSESKVKKKREVN